MELFCRSGRICDAAGHEVSIKGINFFGGETADFALHGLWCANLNTLLDFTAQHFNALRVPFSCELALNMDARQPGNIDYGANPELQGLTTGQVFDRCAAGQLLLLVVSVCVSSVRVVCACRVCARSLPHGHPR